MPLLFRCPVCAKPLSSDGRTCTCENRHAFDIASEGYVNLAAAKKGVNADSGDASDSVRARRAFLACGAYQPLADALARSLADLPRGSVLDAGCGEGYYTRTLRDALPALSFTGVDLAKTAIRLAAKAEKHAARPISYAVAGVFDLPFPDDCFAAVVSVFAPVAAEENRRVLTKGGRMVVASPGKRHLYELKAALYDSPAENEEKLPAPDGFTLRAVTPVAYSMPLSAENVRSLFAMTPYYYRSSAAVRERSKTLPAMTVTADFRVAVFEKN